MNIDILPRSEPSQCEIVQNVLYAGDTYGVGIVH